MIIASLERQKDTYKDSSHPYDKLRWADLTGEKSMKC